MRVESKLRLTPEHEAKDHSFHVGSATVYPHTREVVFNGHVEKIQDKPLRVLQLLAAHRGQLVSRETIVEECWDGRIVGDDVINRAISILRKLAARAGGFGIDTVPRSGYRLVENGASSPRRRWTLVGAGIAILLIALLSLRLAERQIEPGLPSIEVRSDGNATSAPSLRGDMAEAVREVGYQVSERSGDLALTTRAVDDRGGSRIDITLTDAGGSLPLITNSYRRPGASMDSLAVEAVADTASSLTMVGPLLRLMKNRGDNAERAALFSITENFRRFDAFRGRELAMQAAADFPDSPATQYAFALSTIITLEGLPEAERAAQVNRARKALALSEKLSPGLGSNGQSWCVTRPRVWMAECEQRLRRNLENSPWLSESRQALVELYAETGRFQEGARLSRLAVSNEPYVPRAIQQRLILLEMIGHQREADSVYADAIKKFPANWSIRWGRLISLAAAGDFDRLGVAARTIPEVDFTFDAAIVQGISKGYKFGDRAAVKKACSADHLRGSTRHVCASALSLLGETEAALAMANGMFPPIAGRDTAEDERLWLKNPNYFTTIFLSSPAAAPLRRDPRFDAIAERAGLRRYWRTAAPDFCRGNAPEKSCGRLLAHP
ncbi:MAG TPA: winged helix-turn-helix domain-containing protein [Sphingomicrobium sp.]|nr:winged helix-turn-helix domain-containing protein [Sphingomicrobium sp.]